MNYPDKITAWRSSVVIFILTCIAMADRFAVSMLIGPIKADFGIGDFQASLLVGAAFALFYILFLMPIGWASDRFSRLKVLLICLIIWSLATVVSGLATSFVMLFLLRMLVGAGEAGVAPCAHGIIGDSFPREKITKPMALQGIGIQVGAALGVYCAGLILSAASSGFFQGLPLIGDLAGWRLAFIMIGLAGLFAVFLIPLIHDPTAQIRQQSQAAKEPLIPFIQRQAFLTLSIMLTAGISAMGLGIVTTWVPEFTQREFSMVPAVTGAKLGTVLLLSAIISPSIFGTLVDRFATRGMLDAPIRLGLIPIFLASPLVFVTYQLADEGNFFFWQFLLLCCMVPMTAMANSCMQQIALPQFRSRLASMQVLIITIFGFALGPALVGGLSEYVFGEQRLGTAMTLILLISTILTLIMMLILMTPFKRLLQSREHSPA